MHKLFATLGAVLVHILISAQLSAVPMMPMAPADIEGTIVELKWHPEQMLKARGMSGSAGVDRIRPARFEVRLEPFEIKRAKNSSAWRTDRLAGQSGRLLLNHFQQDYLKKGMRIKVTAYRMGGDEGGTWSGYQKLEVLSADGTESHDARPLDLAVGMGPRLRPLRPGTNVKAGALATNSSGNVKDVTVDLILSRKSVFPSPAPRTDPTPNSTAAACLKLGQTSVSFEGSCTVPVSLQGTIPKDTPEGTYYLGVVLDAGNQVKETCEENNAAFVEIQVQRPPTRLLSHRLEIASDESQDFDVKLRGPGVVKVTISWAGFATRMQAALLTSDGVSLDQNIIRRGRRGPAMELEIPEARLKDLGSSLVLRVRNTSPHDVRGHISVTLERLAPASRP